MAPGVSSHQENSACPSRRHRGIGDRWAHAAALLAVSALAMSVAGCDAGQSAAGADRQPPGKPTVLTYEGPDTIGPQTISTQPGTSGSSRVTCWRVGEVIHRFEGPPGVNWNAGGAEAIRGDDLASANSSISLKWSRWFVSAFRPKGVTTTANTITFTNTELTGGDAYSTNNRSTSVKLNGTLSCTDFVEGPGEKVALPSSKTSPTPSSGSEAKGALPGATATAYYHALGKRAWKKACSYWDPRSAITPKCTGVVEGLTTMGDQMGGKKSSYVSDYLKVKVRESDVKVSGDRATFSYVYRGDRYDDVPMVRRDGRWYLDVAQLEKLLSGGD